MAELVAYAQVGGGRGSWIGEVHRRAARSDGRIRLVAGCFSSTPEGSRRFAGESLPGVPAGRVYGTVAELIEGELALPEDERVRFVAVCTPNRSHAEQCLALIAAGFHVVCDKPLTEDVAAAVRVRDAARERGTILALTHNYSGYAMVKEARALVAAGRIGALRKVVVEYPQGWLAPPEAGGSLSASGGISTLVDVGTHAEHIARYVTGLRVEELVSDSSTFVGGTREPDDFSVLLRYGGRVRGVLVATQVHSGELNPLRLRVYGDAGGLEWCHDRPDELVLRERDRPEQLLSRGCPYLSPEARHLDVLPPGHATGYCDGMAAIYSRVASCVAARAAGREPSPLDLDFPTGDDGVESLRFVDAVYRSAASGRWVKVERAGE